MGNKSTAVAIQQGENVRAGVESLVDYMVWIRSEEPSEATIINTATIKQIVLKADMDALLPIANFVISDANRFFSTIKLQLGETIYMRVSPKNLKDPQKHMRYLDTKFCILNIDTWENTNTGHATYNITCCYDAPKLLAATVQYPISSTGIYSEAETSDIVLSHLFSYAGLTLTSVLGKSTDDSMHWINGRSTVKKFIRKVLNHSWIEEGDALIAYTDLNGEATLSSINTLIHTAPSFNLISTAAHTHRGTDKTALLYKTLNVREFAGLSTVNNAYCQKTTVYSPENNSLFTMTDLSEFQYIDSVDLTHPNTFCAGYRQVIYENPEKQLASNTNKLIGLMDITNGRNDAGMHFQNQHDHYDVAPYHNKAIISSFFNTKIDIDLDLNRQQENVLSPKRFPKLAQKVTLDCGTTESENRIYQGDYIIYGLQYQLNDNGGLALKMTLVSDGYNSNGSMNKSTAKDS